MCYGHSGCVRQNDIANMHFSPCMQDFKNKILHIRMNIVFLP